MFEFWRLIMRDIRILVWVFSSYSVFGLFSLECLGPVSKPDIFFPDQISLGIVKFGPRL